MMDRFANENRKLKIVNRQSLDEQNRDLKAQLQKARQQLLDAEAELAQEQAAVNAFRMHCRLKLDTWINTLLQLQTERQSLLTRLELLRQAEDFGLPFDADDPFWRGEDEAHEPSEDDSQGVSGGRKEELILPTDTPRDKAAEKRLYRHLARRFHPDLGVTAVEIAYRTEVMTTVNTAYSAGDTQTLYDLADQLNPQNAAELAGIESGDIRRLRTQILRCRQRRRKILRRQAALRQENTARLWRKAQRIEGAEDTHWWEIVRREIERASHRLRADNDRLTAQIESLEIAQEEKAPELD